MEQTDYTKSETETSTQKAQTSREEDWNQLQKELDVWGENLEALQKQSNSVGEALISDLQERYETLKRETEALKESTDFEIADARKEMMKISEAAQSETSSLYEKVTENARESAETAKQLSEKAMKRSGETAKAMSDSAQELGTAFSRAWVELRKGFQQAYSRLN